MLAYLRRRVLSSALPLLVVILGVFFLARLTGDPTNLYLPLSATAQQRAEFAARNGFDQPVVVQFVDYVGQVVRLDFGESLRTAQPAATAVLRAFPATLQLAGTAMVVAVLAALVVGSLAAYRPNSAADRAATNLASAASSTPDFWFAIMGVLVFAVWLGWLPTSGTAGAAAWILPVVTLLIRPFGVLVQVVRGAMVTALSAPYVKLARSKGATERQVIFGHALRNAGAPVLTVAGDLAVGLINGAVVVETIFGWPGIGKLMIDSILQRDFAVLQAAVLVTAVAIFLLNILIDVGYALLDARVRQGALA
ncbi:ABC transporter permease [Actinomycetes bacterium KLBMP 9759]